ncbi:hypothetical protein EYZ11_005711 [Aspergillus tanneri]|uniref:Uncharacterized protein n=1 Tax=Aspergillus tanneri TaxID=1220188 RepID=A0A4V3UPE0_9EURO|nr:hypothetical protein EYZ11_005711 [Aspergillus tanneri]
MPRVKRKTKARTTETCLIASYEEAESQANLILQATEQRLRNENERLGYENERIRNENQVLRNLLASSDVDHIALGQHLTEEYRDGASDENQLGLSPVTNTAPSAIELYSDPTPLHAIFDSVESPTTMTEAVDLVSQSPSGLALSPPTAFYSSFGLPMPNIYAPNSLERVLEPHLVDFLSLTNQNISGEIAAGLVDAVHQDTTLCTVAIQIVDLCNKKNVNILELDNLGVGFECA